MKNVWVPALIALVTAFAAAPGLAEARTSACPKAVQIVPSESGPDLTDADREALCTIVATQGAGTGSTGVSADLDWENAFGIRYTNLKKLQTFYGAVVAPLQATASDSTIEVKLRGITPDVAIADEYWHIVGQLDVVTHKVGADRWGRTTYVFSKTNGAWIDIVERVADLRAPYFHHYDTLPSPVPLDNATLDAMAGTYALPNNRASLTVTRVGDHFDIAYRTRKLSGIPTSPTELLIFDPTDLAEYRRITFAPSGETLSNDAGDISYPLTKQP